MDELQLADSFLLHVCFWFLIPSICIYIYFLHIPSHEHNMTLCDCMILAQFLMD